MLSSARSSRPPSEGATELSRVPTLPLGDGGTGGGDLLARLVREQADAQETRNATARGERIPRCDVVAGMQGMIANARARRLAIPSKAAPLVATQADARAVQAILGALVEEALLELAATRVVPAASGVEARGSVAGR